MKKLLAWMLVIVALCLSGCVPADSENPLSDPKSAEIDQRLLGMWSTGDGALIISQLDYNQDGKKIETNQIQLIILNTKVEGGTLFLKGFITKLSNGNYFNLKLRTYSVSFLSTAEDSEKNKIKYTDTYWIVRYDMPTDNKLTLSCLDDEKAANLVAKGMLEGETMDVDDPRLATTNLSIITSSTGKLAQLVRDMKHEDLFEKCGDYQRIHLSIAR